MLKKLILLVIFLPFLACKKDKNEDVRSGGVNEYLNLNEPTYLDLNVPGNYVYYPAGTRGIIVYRRSTTEFIAYERSCPYDPQKSTGLVTVETTFTSAADSTCGSRFSIYDGSIINGPTTQSLSQYRTEMLSGNILHIFN
jgi:nitrite reductase/ring-hydroxylating ferredoxin subunit